MILQCGGGTVDETVMLRGLLEGLPVQVQDSYSSTAEVGMPTLLPHPPVFWGGGFGLRGYASRL